MGISKRCFSLVGITLAMVITVQSWNNPSRKTFWAKRIESDDLYVAGRLSLRQIKYASESGFKTILNLHPFNTVENENLKTLLTGDFLPSSQKAESQTYITFKTILPNDEWASPQALSAARQAIQSATKPLILCSRYGYAAAYVMLQHLAKQGTIRPEQVSERGTSLGYDFNSRTLLRLTTNVTGVDVQVRPTPNVPINVNLWYEQFWGAKHVYENWFVYGQISESDINRIKRAGFNVIVNHRKGLTMDNAKTQEEVTLLNIKDRTGTYDDNGVAIRQTEAELQSNRIDNAKSPLYIHKKSTLNYDRRNPLEFGDDVGYNEQIEKASLASFKYIHLPIGKSKGYSKETWMAYRDQLYEADKTGLVLNHCRTAFRSAFWTLMLIADKNKFNSAWAIQRAKEIGFNYDKAPYKDVFAQVLDNAASNHNRLSYAVLLIAVFIAMSM